MNSLFKTVTASPSGQQADHNVVSLQQGSTCLQKIFIKDLKLEMSIGVFDEEKNKKQPVVVNVELQITPNSDWRSDDIDNVVSYADIAENIKNISQTKHFNLVETFAEEIIESCFSNSAVLSVNVSVEKPDAITDATSTGATIYKSRD